MKNLYALITSIFLMWSIALNAQWVHVGLDNYYVEALVKSPNNASDNTLFAGTNGNGVFISTNNGIDWASVNTGLNNLYIKALAISDTNIFAGTVSGIYRSTNNGVRWILIKTTDSAVECFAIASNEISGKNLFALTSQNIYRSTNNGEDWTQLDKPGGWGLTLAVGTNKQGDSSLYLGVGYEADGSGKIYRSNDDGINWSLISQDIYTHMVYTLAFSSNSDGEMNFFAGTWSDGVFLSTNLGENWTQINDGFSYSNYDLAINTFFVFDTTVFVGTCYQGVYIWNNDERSWNNINEGLASLKISSLAVSSSYLLAGTYDGGVWRRPLSEMITSLENTSMALPNQFALNQNYPNPFNPTTTIQYSIPQRSSVKLKVYDLLGNEIAELVNEEKDRGVYSVSFDASGLASGIYLYKIQAGSFVETKKMVLLK